jgi:S1-C subfamily serine protease
MRGSWRSNFAAAVCGGLVVAGALLAFGLIGRRSTQTVVQEAPEPLAQPVAGRAVGLTPHAIYLRDAPGVAFIRSTLVHATDSPFDPYRSPKQRAASGSGFLISSSGYVLTNYHLIAGAEAIGGITVRFVEGAARPAVVVSQDENDDLALLKVDMQGLSPTVRPLELGDSSSVRVGDPTLAIGNPYGLDRTLTSGIVSGLEREIRAPDGFKIDNVIQTDAPINPGNSGGPLLDGYGRVIGINSQIVTGNDRDGGSVGIAFAVPIDTAKQFVPWLGHPGAATATASGQAGTVTRNVAASGH